MDIKKYLVKYTKAEYDARNRADFEAEHERIEKERRINMHVKEGIIEERKAWEREQAKIWKQRQREREREQEIEVGKRNSDGTLITRKVSHIIIIIIITYQSTHKHIAKTRRKRCRRARPYDTKKWIE